VPTHGIMTVAINVGTRFPAYATAMGRVLLAGLEPSELEDYFAATTMRCLTPKTITSPRLLRAALKEVDRAGYSLVEQELEIGLCSIATPIRVNGSVVAAVNVSMHAGRNVHGAAEQAILPSLLSAARAIEADLAASGSWRSSWRTVLRHP